MACTRVPPRECASPRALTRRDLVVEAGCPLCVARAVLASCTAGRHWGLGTNTGLRECIAGFGDGAAVAASVAACAADATTAARRPWCTKRVAGQLYCDRADVAGDRGWIASLVLGLAHCRSDGCQHGRQDATAVAKLTLQLPPRVGGATRGSTLWIRCLMSAPPPA